MSKQLFNQLSFGTAGEVRDLLANDVDAPDSQDLVAALVNAFGMINRLQADMAELQKGKD